jgi:hypothetical protein
VERRAREVGEPREVGDVRVVQHTGGRDDHVDDVDLPARRGDVPLPVDPLAAGDLLVEARAPLHVVLGRDPAEVLLDLVAG